MRAVLTPECGAEYLRVEPLLVFAYLGRVCGEVVAGGRDVYVDVALAARGAAGAAGAPGPGAEAERKERALLLLQRKELLLRAHGRVGGRLLEGVRGGGRHEGLGGGGLGGGRGRWVMRRRRAAGDRLPVLQQKSMTLIGAATVFGPRFMNIQFDRSVQSLMQDTQGHTWRICLRYLTDYRLCTVMANG